MKFVIEIDPAQFGQTSKRLGISTEIARCLRYLADEIDREGTWENLPVTDTYNRLVGNAGFRSESQPRSVGEKHARDDESRRV